MTSLYLINPVEEVPTLDTAPGYISVPDLAIVTVAAMAPSAWSVTICEEAVSHVDLETPARFVGLTGKNAQLSRIVELSEAFRARGKVVLVGGPLASLNPNAVRPHADILVTGEIEDIAPRLFDDLQSGSWRNFYEGGRPDLRSSPVPRWDLYPVDRAMMGALQTTRGCPFECEFCDVIMYNGRKQRHKDGDQICRELDALYEAGFRQVFLTDDNFTVHRRFARDVLSRLAEWNGHRPHDPVRFVTQASIDIARDADLLDASVAAGLDHLFVGIETVNAAALRGTRKRQNLLMPALEAVRTIVSRGILVRNGMMVGFDEDGPDIFDAQFEFLQQAPLPTPAINLLTASPGTPLHARLEREGRLLDGERLWIDSFGCNFHPRGMSREQLFFGAWDLVRRLFEPAAFEQRMNNLLKTLGEGAAPRTRRPAKARLQRNPRGNYALSRLSHLRTRGAAEAGMMTRLLSAAAATPEWMGHVVTCLVFYEQYQLYFDNLLDRVPELRAA